MNITAPSAKIGSSTYDARTKTRNSWIPRWLWIEVALPLAFCGIILGTNYVLTAFPNVKLFDLMVFVAGYALGFRRGATVATASWLVYGTFNPWGATTLPLLMAVTFSEILYAIAGALFRRMQPMERLSPLPGRHSLLLAAVALTSTVSYDVVTNLYTGVSWAQFAGSSDYGRWVLIALFNPGALWFSAMHIGGNVVSFSLLAPALIKATKKAKEIFPW